MSFSEEEQSVLHATQAAVAQLDLRTLQGDVEALAASQENADTRLQLLEDLVRLKDRQLEGPFQRLQNTQSSLQARLESVIEVLETRQAEFERRLGARCDALEVAVAALQQRQVDGQAERVDEIARELAGVRDACGANGEELRMLQGEVQEVVESLDWQDVHRNTRAVEILEEEVREVKKRFASVLRLWGDRMEDEQHSMNQTMPVRMGRTGRTSRRATTGRRARREDMDEETFVKSFVGN